MPGDISVATNLKAAFRNNLGAVLNATEISSAESSESSS
jgi:hypothetical protein